MTDKTPHDLCNEGDVALSTAARCIRALRDQVRAAEARERDQLRSKEYFARMYGLAERDKAKLKRQLAATRGVVTRLKGKQR